MTKTVFLISLRDVPDDEAADMRALLQVHGIEYFETPAGRWGISAPALWLKDGHRLQTAKALIDQYQKDRSVSQKAEYERLKREGRNRTFADVLREEPLRVVLYIAIVGIILYFSIKPFFALGE